MIPIATAVRRRSIITRGITRVRLCRISARARAKLAALARPRKSESVKSGPAADYTPGEFILKFRYRDGIARFG